MTGEKHNAICWYSIMLHGKCQGQLKFGFCRILQMNLSASVQKWQEPSHKIPAVCLYRFFVQPACSVGGVRNIAYILIPVLRIRFQVFRRKRCL